MRTGERRTRPESHFCKALLPYFSGDVVAIDALLLQEHVKTALVLSQGMTSNSEHKGRRKGKKNNNKKTLLAKCHHIFIIRYLLLALTSAINSDICNLFCCFLIEYKIFGRGDVRVCILFTQLYPEPLTSFLLTRPLRA